ncbi:MAG: hypothetical protein AAFU64_06290 [Bacteroidota bacterium]
MNYHHKQYFEYQFQLKRTKLGGVLRVLASFAEYQLKEEELQLITKNLRISNQQLDKWLDYFLVGKKASIDLHLASDHKDSHLIHIRLKSLKILREKIETLDRIQALMKKFES